MKRLFVLLLLALTVCCNYAQVIEWAIKPVYQEIVPIGKDVYKVKANNNKWGVYNVPKGQLTVKAEYDSITAVVEGRALLLDHKGMFLYGIISEDGSPVGNILSASQQPDFIVSSEYPYFSDGLLAVGQIPAGGGECLFGYVNKQGKAVVAFDNYYASPFDNGYAMVWSSKKTYRIINKQGVSQYQGNEDIRFISNPKDNEFLLVTGNKVRLARLEDNKFKTIRNIDTGGRIVDVADATRYYTISCRGGDTFRFDKAFHYIEYGEEPVYSVSIPESIGNLKSEKVGRYYGLSYDGVVLLKEQFRDVRIFDDYAVVTTTNGMKGLVEYNPLGLFSLSGPSEPIEFYHNSSTSVPVNITCSDFVSMPTIELTFDGKTETVQGSGQATFAYYEPHTEYGKTTSRTIPIEVTIDGLKYGSRNIDVSSFHSKGFKVSSIDIPSHSNMNGNATVQLTIQSINGVPSSAVADVNKVTKSFDGKSSVSFKIPFTIPAGEAINVKINIKVEENNCPVWTDNKGGTIEHLSRK